LNPEIKANRLRRNPQPREVLVMLNQDESSLISEDDIVFSVFLMCWITRGKRRHFDKLKLAGYVVYILDEPVYKEDTYVDGVLHKKGSRYLPDDWPRVMKIGVTSLDDPDALAIRARQISGSMPGGTLIECNVLYARVVIWYGFAVEKQMHEKFEYAHIEGEWFRITEFERAKRCLMKFPGADWPAGGISKGFVKKDAPLAEVDSASLRVYPNLIAETAPASLAEVDSASRRGRCNSVKACTKPGDKLIFSAFKSDKIDNPVIVRTASCNEKVVYPGGDVLTIKQAATRAYVDLGLKLPSFGVSGSRCFKVQKTGELLRTMYEKMRDYTDEMPEWRRKKMTAGN